LVANLADLEQATALVPDDPLAWSERAVAEERLGRCDAALRSYTRALTLEPSIETYSDRAQFYLDTGDVPAAIADLTAAIGLPQTERHDSLRRQRAELLLEHRDFRAAREAFAELAGIVPDDAEAARGLADAAQALNDDDAAALRERADALEERWRADLASGRAGARYPLAARILGLPIADEPAD
jgi:tetratricopeptide (TPR) repeat protein